MSTLHTNDVFDAFVAAKAAIDKVPELEAQITKLTTSLNDVEALLSLGDDERRRLRNDLDTITAAKGAAEVALDLQRKSNEDLQARFDLVVGTLRSLAGDIGSTISVVEPQKPEPVVEVVSVSSDPTAATFADSPLTSSAASATEGQSATDPTGANGTGTVTAQFTFAEDTPFSDSESVRKQKGLDWFDKNNNHHLPTMEVTPTAPVPFVASTAAPSAPAQSTEPTSLAAPPAAQSDGALPDFITRKWGYDNTI